MCTDVQQTSTLSTMESQKNDDTTQQWLIFVHVHSFVGLFVSVLCVVFLCFFVADLSICGLFVVVLHLQFCICLWLVCVILN